MGGGREVSHGRVSRRGLGMALAPQRNAVLKPHKSFQPHLHLHQVETGACWVLLWCLQVTLMGAGGTVPGEGGSRGHAFGTEDEAPGPP